MRRREEWEGVAAAWRGNISRETVLAAECRVTYIQGLNDFEPKRARCQNKEDRGVEEETRGGKREEKGYYWN